MAIEELIQEIKKEANKEVEDIIKKANEEARSLLEKAKEEAKEKAQEILKDGEKRAEATKERILATARREGKRYVVEAKEKLINECIEEIKKELKKIDKKNYKKYIERAFKEAMEEIPDGYVMVARKEDEEIAKKLGVEVRGRINAIGGFIMISKDGSKEINYTFDEMLEMKKDKIRIKIADKLWK